MKVKVLGVLLIIFIVCGMFLYLMEEDRVYAAYIAGCMKGYEEGAEMVRQAWDLPNKKLVADNSFRK